MPTRSAVPGGTLRDFSEQPHRRLNALTGEWVLVSPHRAQRPWQGQVERIAQSERPQYDPGCYLCPGNTRANGQVNPPYPAVYAFDNDFAALLPDVAELEGDVHDLLVARAETGICRVVCFSPRHDLSLAEMEVRDIRQVVDLWTEEYHRLGSRPDIRHVQIFENKGAVMGCSNPHPHGQIWAQSSVPAEPAREQKRTSEYFAVHGRTLLSDYLALELEQGDRVVCANDSFVVLVPFWAVWPFETLVISRRAVADLLAFTDPERADFALILKQLTVRYDRLFNVSFPYSAGMHQRPTDGADHRGWHFHMHFYPPLLRSATVRKFMVGYEMLGEPQRDITPEMSAARLRELPETLAANSR